MRVQSFDRADVTGVFDESQGLISTYRDVEVPADVRSQSIRGQFAFLSGLLVCLYRADDVLSLRIGGVAARLADGVAPTVRAGDLRSTLVLVDGSTVLTQVSYAAGPEWGPPLAVDPTPFVEAEDWDFGRWIVNVVADPDRAGRMWGD